MKIGVGVRMGKVGVVIRKRPWSSGSKGPTRNNGKLIWGMPRMKMGNRLRKKRRILDSGATPKAPVVSSPTALTGKSLKWKKVEKK